MPIEPTGSPNQPDTTRQGDQVSAARNQPTASQQETGTPSSIETVTLTDIAQQLNTLEHNISILPAVDVQRVETIRQSLTDGSYQIDSNRIAEKFLAFEAALKG